MSESNHTAFMTPEQAFDAIAGAHKHLVLSVAAEQARDGDNLGESPGFMHAVNLLQAKATLQARIRELEAELSYLKARME